MQTKIFKTDKKWIDKYFMDYISCPKCKSSCFYRIESMCINVHCNSCGGVNISFMDDLPDEVDCETTREWKEEMRKDFIKYRLKTLNEL